MNITLSHPQPRGSSHSSLKYRQEIDGLRAVAVLPVILFHAGFEMFSGGYVGVDVFFVISGYLITAIIVSEMGNGAFSLTKFYERRARRILPALFLVIFLCLPFAWLWMTPQQLRRFAQSIVSVSLFGSNVFFWHTSGYFDTAAEEKPLLHTWSLGVEEQFYVLFPLFIISSWRVGLRRLGWIVFALAVLSLGLSEVVSSYGSAAANFFLTPTRAWELLLGSLIALSSTGDPIDERFTAKQNNIVSCIGLGLIVFSVFTYDKSTPFPGAYALAPTLGTGLILAFGTKKTFVAKMLSLRWIVAAGLISYSAYLWHQPLLAFARIYSINKPSNFILATASVASIGLAYLTWRFIEQPFRDRQVISRKMIVLLAVSGTITFTSIGLAGHLSRGFEKLYVNRLSDEQAFLSNKLEEAISTGGYSAMFDNLECKFWDRTITNEFIVRYEQCAHKYGKAILVLGDSHAMDLYNSIAQNSSSPFIVGVSQGGCRPHSPLPECHYEKFSEFIRREKDTVRIICYTQSGGRFLTGNAKQRIHEEFAKRTYDYLFELSQVVPTIWLGPQAELAEDIRSINALRGKYVPNFRNEIIRVDEYLDGYNSQRHAKSMTYLSMLKATEFKPSDFYYDDAFTYSDSDHWSSHGERVFGSRLVKHKIIASYIQD